MRLFTSKCQLETAWALLDHLQLCSNETQLYKKYFLNFISIKLIGIIISPLKSAFLKSVSVFLGLPDYMQEATISYLPEEAEEASWSLVTKASSGWCRWEAEPLWSIAGQESKAAQKSNPQKTTTCSGLHHILLVKDAGVILTLLAFFWLRKSFAIQNWKDVCKQVAFLKSMWMKRP